MTAVRQARLPRLLHFSVSYEAPDQFPRIVHMLLIVPFGSPCNFPGGHAFGGEVRSRVFMTAGELGAAEEPADRGA